MASAVLIKKALREALAAHLQTQLAPSFPGIVCSGEWPTAGKALPPIAVTVTTPGEQQTEFHPTVPHAVSNISGTTADVVYSFGHVEQGLQIDLWATYRAVRDDVAQAIYFALNLPPNVTLGLGGLPNWSQAAGLVLRIPLLFNVPADFQFGDSPRTPESSDAAQQGEWRATWIGTASLETVDKENVPLMQQINFNVDVKPQG